MGGDICINLIKNCVKTLVFLNNTTKIKVFIRYPRQILKINYNILTISNMILSISISAIHYSLYAKINQLYRMGVGYDNINALKFEDVR